MMTQRRLRARGPKQEKCQHWNSRTHAHILFQRDQSQYQSTLYMTFTFQWRCDMTMPYGDQGKKKHVCKKTMNDFIKSKDTLASKGQIRQERRLGVEAVIDEKRENQWTQTSAS